MNKSELIKEVKNRTEIGKAVATMEFNFIRWIAKRSMKEAEKK